MNYNREVCLQRLKNSQNAMETIKEYLTGLQHGTRAGWDEEKIINEIEEIISFLDWAKQQ